MKNLFKSLLVASVSLAGITVSGVGYAGVNKEPQSFGQKVSYKGDHNRGGNNYNKRSGNNNWSRGRGNNSRNHDRRGHNRWRGRGHNTGNVFLGLGLGYLMFGGNRNRIHYVDRNYYQPRYAPRYVEIEPKVIYRDRPTYQESVGNAQRNGFDGASCLQIREYQTIITIGGEEKEAYGDACLQPDGNWIQGAPKTIPNFN